MSYYSNARGGVIGPALLLGPGDAFHSVTTNSQACYAAKEKLVNNNYSHVDASTPMGQWQMKVAGRSMSSASMIQQQQPSNGHYNNFKSSSSLGPTFKTVTLTRLPEVQPINGKSLFRPTEQESPSSAFGLSLRAHVVMSPHPSMVARSFTKTTAGSTGDKSMIGPAPLPAVLVFVMDASKAHCAMATSTTSVHKGDQVVAINGISVLNVPSLDFVEQLIAQSGSSLALTVSPVEAGSSSFLSSSSCQQRSDDENGGVEIWRTNGIGNSSVGALNTLKTSNRKPPALVQRQQPIGDANACSTKVSVNNIKEQFIYNNRSTCSPPSPDVNYRRRTEGYVTHRPASIIGLSGTAIPRQLSDRNGTVAMSGLENKLKQHSDTSSKTHLLTALPSDAQRASKLTAFVPPMAAVPVTASLPSSVPPVPPVNKSSGIGERQLLGKMDSAPIMVQVNPQIHLTLNSQPSSQIGPSEIPCKVGHVSAKAYLASGLTASSLSAKQPHSQIGTGQASTGVSSSSMQRQTKTLADDYLRIYLPSRSPLLYMGSGQQLDDVLTDQTDDTNFQKQSEIPAADMRSSDSQLLSDRRQVFRQGLFQQSIDCGSFYRGKASSPLSNVMSSSSSSADAASDAVTALGTRIPEKGKMENVISSNTSMSSSASSAALNRRLSFLRATQMSTYLSDKAYHPTVISNLTTRSSPLSAL